MKLLRRQFLHLAAGAAVLPVVSRLARAQTYPTRPVRIIVGFPPGGAYDIHARLMGQWLSERLGQPFIIENRPGAGSNIATDAAVRAAADGYTLLLVGTDQAMNVTAAGPLQCSIPAPSSASWAMCSGFTVPLTSRRQSDRSGPVPLNYANLPSIDPHQGSSH
jgi:hypothetical protein